MRVWQGSCYRISQDGSQRGEAAIAVGVLKIKTKLGELLPAGKPGRGNKPGKQVAGINKSTVTAYRKMAANAEKRVQAIACTSCTKNTII